MLSGERVWNYKEDLWINVIKNVGIKKMIAKLDVSDNAKNLLTGLLNLQISKRLTFDKFFWHPWLSLSRKSIFKASIKSHNISFQHSNKDSLSQSSLVKEERKTQTLTPDKIKQIKQIYDQMQFKQQEWTIDTEWNEVNQNQESTQSEYFSFVHTENQGPTLFGDLQKVVSQQQDCGSHIKQKET